MDPQDDPLGRLRAEMDQAKEGVREFALTLGAFHNALLDQEFDRDEAMVLTLAFLGESLGQRGTEE